MITTSLGPQGRLQHHVQRLIHQLRHQEQIRIRTASGYIYQQENQLRIFRHSRNLQETAAQQLSPAPAEQPRQQILTTKAGRSATDVVTRPEYTRRDATGATSQTQSRTQSQVRPLRPPVTQAQTRRHRRPVAVHRRRQNTDADTVTDAVQNTDTDTECEQTAVPDY